MVLSERRGVSQPAGGARLPGAQHRAVSRGHTPQPGDISGWLETFTGAFLSALPEDARPGFIAELREALRPALLNADGTWVVDYVRLRFAAD